MSEEKNRKRKKDDRREDDKLKSSDVNAGKRSERTVQKIKAK